MKEYSYEKTVKNPAVFADNRLPAHSDHIAYSTEEELEMDEEVRKKVDKALDMVDRMGRR